MAYYAALSSLTNLLHDLLSQHRHPNYLLGKESLINSLHQYFTFLEESLQHYSSTGDEAADCVEERIRELAQRVLDIIETGIYNQYHIDLGETSITPCDCTFCGHEQLHSEEVKQQVDSIVEELRAFKDVHGNQNLKSQDNPSNVGASDTNITVGLDGYVNDIKEQLCGSSSQRHVISIVGMGGIGKTTLATKTFDDSLVSYHFYCRAWTTISQEYNQERVLQSLKKSLTAELGDLRGDNDDPLEERIYKSLKGQRYLIVLDDVWSTQVLGDMLRIFPDDSNGSRILLTTILLDVASYFSSSSLIHDIPILNADESWNLLREKLFAQQHCPPEMESIGKLIASKCGGLPLAVVAIAGVLEDRKTPQYWEKVASNATSILNGDGEQLSNILSLSYNHLSHQLKSCFLFIGCFREGIFIPIRVLALMWSAEGFLKSSSGAKSLDQVAEECVAELVKKNLITLSRNWYTGEPIHYRMHDLVREYCRKRSFKEQFCHSKDWESHLNGHRCEDDVRRIIPYTSTCESSHKAFCCIVKQSWACDKYKLVRSFVWDAKEDWATDLKRFKLLRLLYMPKLDNVLTAFDFSNLFLLKYLFLASSAIRNSDDCLIPLFKLPNLETLHIYGELGSSFSVPSEFWCMPRLKCLIVKPMDLPPILENSSGSIQNQNYLETLYTVKNFVFSSEAIEMIFNLRVLSISCQGEDSTSIDDLWDKYCLNNLSRLPQLEALFINLALHMPSSSNIVLPLNLEQLCLGGCRLPWKEVSSVIGSLPCLKELWLINDAGVGEEWEPLEGEFLTLKFLWLEGLHDLQSWVADNTNFPCLKTLNLQSCNKLKEIPPGIEDIPTLESITVNKCRYAGESAIRILEEQQSQGNYALKVRVF